MRDCCSVEQIFAVGQAVQQTQNVHECAFARAGCAGHRNVVTVLHGQIDRIERTNTVLSIYFTRMNQFSNADSLLPTYLWREVYLSYHEYALSANLY